MLDVIAIITLALTVGEKLLALIRMASKKVLKKPARIRPKEDLQEELLSSVDQAKIVHNPPHKQLSSEEIEGYRKKLKEMLRNNETQGKFSKEVRGIIDGKPTEVKLGTVITFTKKVVRNKIVLTVALSFVQDACHPTEAFQMLFDMAEDINEKFLPIRQAPEVQEDGTREAMEADKVASLMKDLAGLDVLEENKTRERASHNAKQAKRHGEIPANGVPYNPKCTMSIGAEHGKGEIDVSQCEGGHQWRVIYQGKSTKDVRLVTGNGQMQVSKEFGCHYYEVKLMEMEEPVDSMRMRRGPGVGVGLAHKFEDNKVAGRYRKSYGYDGSVGLAFCERSPCDFKVGSIVAGDTIGIGLFTNNEGSPFVFLTKNGVLQGAMSNVHLAKPSKYPLYPVISLASRRVEILVNFYGPFVLPSIPDLHAAAKKASP